MERDSYFEDTRSDVYKGILFFLEKNLNSTERWALRKEGLDLINYFENFDTRYQTYYILDEIENLLLSGILSGKWSSQGGPGDFLEDCINLTKEVMDEIANSIDQGDTENILSINYKCIYLMIVSLYVLNDVKNLRNSRLGSLFMVNPDSGEGYWDTENLLIELVRLHSSLGLSLINLDKMGVIKLENNTMDRVKQTGFAKSSRAKNVNLTTGFISTTLNDTRATLQTAFGYNFQSDILVPIQNNPAVMFDGFKSNESVLHQIINNTYWLLDRETSADDNLDDQEESLIEEPESFERGYESSEPEQNYEYEYQYQPYQEAESTTYETQQDYANYTGIELLKHNLTSLGINYKIENKAYKNNSMSVLNNYKNVQKITDIFKLIAQCGGNLEAFVSHYSNYKGLNLEFIKNGANCFMSARLNDKNRLCMNQGYDGQINILSFGTHYNNMGI